MEAGGRLAVDAAGGVITREHCSASLSTRRRSTRKRRRQSRLPLPAITMPSAMATVPVHVSSVGCAAFAPVPVA